MAAKNGSHGETCTLNLHLRKVLLYLIELRGQKMASKAGIAPTSRPSQGRILSIILLGQNGVNDESRHRNAAFTGQNDYFFTTFTIKLVGRLRLALSSNRVRAEASLSKFATHRKNWWRSDGNAPSVQLPTTFLSIEVLQTPCGDTGHEIERRHCGVEPAILSSGEIAGRNLYSGLAKA